MRAETAFAIRPASPEIRQVEFSLGGVSVKEFLKSGVMTTASPWLITIASGESPGNGRLYGLLDSRFEGWRISDVVGARWSLDRWRMPSVTELTAFAVATPFFRAPIVSPATYRVRSRDDALWVAYVCGDLLGMWPVNNRLPRSAHVLVVQA